MIRYGLITLAALCCSTATAWGQQRESKIVVQQSDKTLSVSVIVADGVKEIEIRLASDRNRRISNRTDISPNNPSKKRSPLKSNVWYPVVDVALEPHMEAIALFDAEAKGSYSINGMFFDHEAAIATENIIPADKLSHWENTLITEPASLLEGFYLRVRFPVSDNAVHHDFKLLSEVWSGTVSVYVVHPNESLRIAETTLQSPEPSTEPTRLAALRGQDITKERLIESIIATARFELRCQDQSPHTSTSGGLNLFYDLDAKMYRRPHWVWGWGPSIKLLLDASKIPGVTKDLSAERLKEAAIEIGHASRRFQI